MESDTNKLNQLLEFKAIDNDLSADRVKELESAIATFLDAQGHDLCHENRKELAKVIGREYVPPEAVSRCEFAEGCLKYQEQIYGVLKVFPPL